MISLKAFSYVQFSIVLIGVPHSAAQSENPIKILNTENIILTMGDLNVDNNDDLELLVNVSENPDLDEKLEEFHRAVARIQMSGRPYGGQRTVALHPDKLKPTESPSLIKLPRRVKKKRLKWLRKLKSRKYWKSRWTMPKREASAQFVQAPDCSESDFNNLENEYEEFLIKSRSNNTSYRYTDKGKPEESLKDIVNKLIDFRMPSNCTDVTGIGIQAVECIVQKGNANEITRLEMYEKILYILFAWFCIYLGVAIPFWCIKGWCCCCFRCWFCFPNRTVREIDKYIRENPPGVYINSKGEEERYRPNVHEKELYEKIKKAIADY